MGNDTQESIELEESSRIPVSTFSHVEKIWDEKMRPHISYYAVPIMIMGLEDATVVIKTNSSEKRDRESEEREFHQNDLAF